jgi:hypothetical protein
MNLHDVQDRMSMLGANNAVIGETIDQVYKRGGCGTMSIYAVVGNVYQAEVTVLRITWCRKLVHGPETPLHYRAAPILWLGVTANQAP